MELRTAAIVAGVQAMKDAYNKGEDLHTNMAAIVSGKPREVTKGQKEPELKLPTLDTYMVCNQPTFVQYAKIGYGVDMSLEEATRIRNSFFEA